MWPAGQPRPPSRSLPPVRQLDSLCAKQIIASLDNLFAIYCPGVVPKSAFHDASRTSAPWTRFPPLTDSGYSSGYTSEIEEDEEPDFGGPVALEKLLTNLRADEFERRFATKWLTSLIARVEDWPVCSSSEDVRHSVVEEAAELLTALLNPSRDQEEGAEDVEDDKFCREFIFEVSAQRGKCSTETIQAISVRLNDGLAGSRSADHTDVGLQTWGASILLCRIMCDSPSRFGLTPTSMGSSPRIVELGAGTGLVSLVLGQLLPRLGVEHPLIVATDHHLSVIANLRDNIGGNLHASQSALVQICVLDWAQTTLEPSWPLGAEPADILFATDVVYAPEHATLLYGCASRLLAPGGVFWLLATVRQNGRFNDVADTVEAVFARGPRPPGRSLGILETERLEKRSEVGRGDETSYNLFKIGWT